MSYKKCCVPKCKTTRSDQIVMHLFPNPDKELERFTTWKNAIGGHIQLLDSNTIFGLRRVCHIHFETKYHTRSKRLSPNAVPTLYVTDVGSSTQKRTSLTTSVAAPDKSIVQESTSQRPIDEPSSPKQTDTSANASVSAPESIEKPNSNEATESPTIYEEQDVTEELETEHVIPVSKTYTRYKRNEPECTKPEESIVPVAKTYTWEKQSEAVSINADDVADMTEYLEDMNEDLTMFCDDEEPPSPQPGVIGNSYQYDKTLHEGYHCDVCKGEIRGFRYTCVQCSDLDLCSACELDRAHHHHYVLRVPEPRPYAEVQSVLARIRAHLMQKLDPITQSEQDNDDAVSIKSEVKSESEDDEDNYETRSQDSSHSSVSSKTQKQKDHDDEDHTTDNIERLDPPDNEEPIDSIDISSDEETQSNAQDEENNTLGMETSPLSSSVRQQPTSKHKVLPSTVRKKIICNLKDFIRMRQTPPSTGKRIRVMPVLKKADVSTRKEITHKFDFKPQKKMMVVKLPPGAVLNDGLRVLVQRLPLSEDTRHNADIDNR